MNFALVAEAGLPELERQLVIRFEFEHFENLVNTLARFLDGTIDKLVKNLGFALNGMVKR